MKHGDLIFLEEGAKARPVTLPSGESDLMFYRGKVPKVYCGGCWAIVRPKRGQCPTCHRKF